MAFVVDASVTLAWFIDGETTPFTEDILTRLDNEWAYVPPIWPYEVANALLTAERRGRVTQVRVSESLERLNHLAITVDTDIIQRASREVLTVARQFGLTTYDASYIDLAMNRSLPIATNDNRMRTAATRLGLELIEAE